MDGDNNVTNDPTTAITNMANRPWSQSKKWLAFAIGLACVMFIYIATIICIVFTASEKAQHLVNIANIGVVFIGTMTSILLSGQSAVDWKTSSSLENIANQQTTLAAVSNGHQAAAATTGIVVQPDPNTTGQKPFSQLARPS